MLIEMPTRLDLPPTRDLGAAKPGQRDGPQGAGPARAS